MARMNDQNARELIQAGAVAVGMGGWLVGDGSWGKSRLRSRSRILVNAVAGGAGLSLDACCGMCPGSAIVTDKEQAHE